MNEQLQSYATNYLYAVPFAIVLTALFLQFQKSKIKNPARNHILDKSFIIRNSVFVGFLVFLQIYLGKLLPGLEESIIVTPADF